MTRAQWALVAFVGVVAVVAFHRTEIIAQRIGLTRLIQPRRATGGMV